MSNAPYRSAELKCEDWRDASYDRDLGWLKFNRRVLHEALDDRSPLLERLKFLAIFSSNLDEFFMKRIEIQRRQIQELASEGEQKLNLLWAEIRRDVLEMLDLQHQCLSQQLRPALAQRGVHLMDWCELSCEQVEEVRQYFQSHVLPVVTPLAYDPAHPFPFLSNLSTSLGVMLRAPRSDQQVFARV